MHQLDNMAAITDSELPVNNELYSQLAIHTNTLPYSTEGEAPTGWCGDWLYCASISTVSCHSNGCLGDQLYCGDISSGHHGNR